MQDLPENHFWVSGASCVKKFIIIIIIIIIIITTNCELSIDCSVSPPPFLWMRKSQHIDTIHKWLPIHYSFVLVQISLPSLILMC